MHDVVQLCSPCPPVAPLVFAVANDQEDDERTRIMAREEIPVLKIAQLNWTAAFPVWVMASLASTSGSEENQPAMLIAVAG